METTTWNIDSSHSSIQFSVRHMVFSKVRGRFDKVSGKIHLNEGTFAQSSVDVEIDANSIDTAVADRDQHLRSGDFFDVERFPKLTFKSKRIEPINDQHFRIVGDLTIRDATREVVLDAEHGGTGKDPWGNQRIAFSAKTSVVRTEFGLKWNQALETGGVLVGERIDVELEVQAVKE